MDKVDHNSQGNAAGKFCSDFYYFRQLFYFGDAFGLVAAVFYVAYLLMVSRWSTEFSRVTVITWSGVLTCICRFSVILISGGGEVLLLQLYLVG